MQPLEIDFGIQAEANAALVCYQNGLDGSLVQRANRFLGSWQKLKLTPVANKMVGKLPIDYAIAIQENDEISTDRFGGSAHFDWRWMTVGT